MKMILVGLLASISMNAFAAQEAPKDALFNYVEAQAKKFGYFGYDLTVCLDKENKIRVGGVSFWSSPLQIFIVGKPDPVDHMPGLVISTTPTANNDKDKQSLSHEFITSEGQTVVLTFPKDEPGLTQQSSTLSFQDTGAVESLTCYKRISNLE